MTRARIAVDLLLGVGVLAVLLVAILTGVDLIRPSAARRLPPAPMPLLVPVEPPMVEPPDAGRPTGSLLDSTGRRTLPPDGVVYLNGRDGKVVASVAAGKWPVIIRVRSSNGPTWEFQLEENGGMTAKKVRE